jgi:hypothetical protein
MGIHEDIERTGKCCNQSLCCKSKWEIRKGLIEQVRIIKVSQNITQAMMLRLLLMQIQPKQNWHT